MKQTALHTIHVEAGAKMLPFAGWNMPIQYPTGIKQEHNAVRNAVGIFDVSHMGNVRLTGPETTSFLDFLTPWPMSQLPHGKARYTVFMNQNSGVLDDLIVYRLADQDYLIIWNAGNHQQNSEWVQQHLPSFDVTFEDLTDSMSLIAVQGPKWQETIAKALPDLVLPEKRFTVTQQDKTWVARTGYTGEDGVEILLPNTDAENTWNALIQAGALPCGLGARDSLRIEAGLPLYGHELNTELDPAESGIGFILNASHTGYIGHKDNYGPNQLIGVKIKDKGVPREGYEVYNQHHDMIGKISSGTFSPFLDKGLGLALVKNAENLYHTDGYINIRGRQVAIEFVRPPFH